MSAHCPAVRFAILPLLIAAICALAACAPPSQSVSADAEGATQGGSQAASSASAEALRQEASQTEALKDLPDAELAEGWISLFDGKTLFGWQQGSKANWRIEDGAIVVDEGERGLLCTTTEFADYELSLEFNADAKTNSGVFLHTPLRIGPEGVAKECYELNIAPADNPFPTGSLVQRKKAEGDLNRDGWQTFQVTMQGPEVKITLDGKEVLNYADPEPLGRGFIGLQFNEGRVAFRNIKLRPLGAESLFNGKNLEGWKEYPELASRFTVTEEGWLNVKDGRGQLETVDSFGDFVLQFECITHGEHLNSGVFFRCIPGDIMNGYECQIHNGFKDGDRTKPIDCGTGGIFRRQDARIVMSNDREWFHLTLIAAGPHIAAWVNGRQVSDWVDERPPHENPRQGKRVAGGTIQLQGHDPTTDLSFRNLRAAEAAPRRLAVIAE